MIKMPAAPALPEFADQTSAFLSERAKAIAFYKVPANRSQPFKFEAYGNQKIKDALNNHFSLKCAYCESFYGATQPPDVEHYRPKGVVMDGKTKIRPGYYWLAIEWTNLLPSCIDCNRRREQKFTQGKGQSGKGMLFPLRNPQQRAAWPGEEKNEQPLLLHPYDDEPSKHLRFTDDGMIYPRQIGGGPSDRGDATIQVLGLHRDGLNRGRAAKAKEILGSIRRAEDLIELIDMAPTTTMKDRLERLLQMEIADLRQKTSAASPYSAISKQLAAPLLKKFP